MKKFCKDSHWMSLLLPVLKCDYMEKQHLSPQTRASLKAILKALDHTSFRFMNYCSCQKLPVVVLKA